jgi:cytoplasmic tRNA 2-thiolation protein 2
VLSWHLKRQEGNGKARRTTGFRLRVVHVIRESGGRDGDEVEVEKRLERIRERYPEHAYATIDLSDVVKDDKDLYATLASSHPNDTSFPDQDLATILAALPSPTSRADALEILTRRVLTKNALSHSCEAILWADSTTRLAERTLTATAQARGFALPHLISDGETPFGLSFYYPLRELLSKEIASYLSYLHPSVADLVIQRDLKPAVSAKTATIEGLVRQYFEGVEREFPSIVANVVRTVGKLEAKVGYGEADEVCELCEMPMAGQAPERSRLCYGCVRTLAVGT